MRISDWSSDVCSSDLSELVDADGYTCLEVQRFDRTANVLGRRGFVSLLALDAAFVGDGARDWSLAAERLAALGLITADTAARIARLYWFGRLIGNSDMHPGNLGFHLVDAGPLGLAPAYDMLPDRKSVVEGKRVLVRVDLGGRRII